MNTLVEIPLTNKLAAAFQRFVCMGPKARQLQVSRREKGGLIGNTSERQGGKGLVRERVSEGKG